jgi:hypothetical protein
MQDFPPDKEVLSGEHFAAICDDVFWSSARTDNPGRVGSRGCRLVFSHADQVFLLFRRLRCLPGRYVVVTHQSDHSIDDAHFLARPWNVCEWFGANRICTLPGCHGLPLGLADSGCRVTTPIRQLEEVARAGHRTHWLLVNHRVKTNPAVREPLYAQFRTPMWRDWATVQEPGSDNRDYLAGLGSHRFVLCPPGNGMDTHRMWEALYAGCFPVVLRSPVTEAVCPGLPALIIEAFSQLTPRALEAFETGWRDRSWDLSPLRVSHWEARMREAVRRSASIPFVTLLWQWSRRKLGVPR